MNLKHYNIIQRFYKTDLFKRCFYISFFFHATMLGWYYIPKMQVFASDGSDVINLNNRTFENTEVDFIDLPESVALGGDINPAPVQKEEWIEGTGKEKPDAENTEVNSNKLSGTGIDADGYMFADLADHPPIPIINFNPDEFFPKAARSANITRSTVFVEVQVNDNGSVNKSKVLSANVGYGFDDAAVKVVTKMRFRPGKISGKPVKMLVRLPITFTLED
jgi:periplasmic protein TonB